MVDRLSPELRSALMRRVKGRDTAPELAVRRMLHRMGFRFRLHRRDLPGTPDLVLPRHKTVIFVHGCFWHSHGCKIGRAPKSKLAYWEAKLDENRRRDARNSDRLVSLGWRVVTIWGCETRDLENLQMRLRCLFLRA